MSNLIKEIKIFQEYVLSFYNDKTGIYPIASKSEIIDAVDLYLGDVKLSEIYFDSIDRERVRCILEPSYSL